MAETKKTTVAADTEEKVTKRTRKAAPKAETTEEKKPAARKPRKVAAATFVQFGGNEYTITDLTEKVTAAFVEEGNKASAIKSLEIYVKPEEGKAYYVVNGEAEGKSVDL